MMLLIASTTTYILENGSGIPIEGVAVYHGKLESN